MNAAEIGETGVFAVEDREPAAPGIEIEDRLAFRCPAAIGNPLAVAAVPERVEGRIIDIPPASLRFRPAGE